MSIPPRTSRALVLAAGIVLLVGGALLVVRPLTSVLILVWVAALALAAVAVAVLRRSAAPLPARVAVALVALASAVAALVWLPKVATALPPLTAVAAVGGFVAFAVRAARSGRLARRVGAGALAVVCGGVAWTVWRWPDLGVLAVGGLFAVAIALSGVLLILRGLRGTSTGSRMPRRIAGTVSVTAAVIVAVVGVSLSVVVGAPGERPGAFYEWEGEVPAPGTLLRSEPYDGEVPAGATASRILYSTTDRTGAAVVASAVVAMPTEGEEHPVLAWQHGTTGVSAPCAPSLTDEALTEYAIPGIARAIERGWAVVATDYPGQGTSGPYPYLVGEGEGRATLDAVRAAHAVDGASLTEQAMIWGHSQGGHASLWAAQIAPEYAPEIEIVSVAALSAAWDPLSLAQAVMSTGGGPLQDVITSFVLIPYADAYPDITLAQSVNPAGELIATTMATRCVTAPDTVVSIISGLATTWDVALFDIDLRTGATHDRLGENVASGIVSAPLFLGQGEDDEVIPIEHQRTLAAQLCADGRDVTVHEYAGKTHMGVIAEGAPLIDDLYAWADRVDAGDATGTCGA